MQGNWSCDCEQQKTELKLFGIAPEELHFFLSELIRLVRTYTALGRSGALSDHAALDSVPGRRWWKPDGASWSARSWTSPRDIFFLRKESLGGLMEGNVEAVVAGKEAGKAKTEYEIQKGTLPAHVWGEGREVHPSEGDLEGLPGSPGLAEGPVLPGALCR